MLSYFLKITYMGLYSTSIKPLSLLLPTPSYSRQREHTSSPTTVLKHCKTTLHYPMAGYDIGVILPYAFKPETCTDEE